VRRAILAFSITLAAGLGPAGLASGRLPSSSIQPSAASPATSNVAATADWSAALGASLRQSEYDAIWQDGTALPGLEAALQSPNRANGLRTYFTSSGIRVVPRTELASSWTWGLTLTRYGLEEALIDGDAEQPVAVGNRVEYQRGSLVEWYVNDERGLEQGFTFQDAPIGVGGTLVIELGVWGSLLPAGGVGDGAIDFTTSNGESILRYASLSATDATGRNLPVAMIVGSASEVSNLIRITVETAGAVYPVTIDPLVDSPHLSRSPNWITESDQVAAWLGYAVGPAGDVNGDGYDDVIVGAYRYDTGQVDEGRAWAFYGSATGLDATADWTVDGPWPGALLGHSVARAGDVNQDGYDDVIVGVPSPNGGTADGWAYAYYGSPAGLHTTPDWTVEVVQDQAWFGRTVRSAGDVNGDGYDDVVVGAPHYDNGQMDEGKAWAYYGSANGLHTTADWSAEENQAWALFGRWVGTAGDVNGDGYDDLIAGAHFWDDDQQNEGRAFAFYGSPAGLHTTADWTADGNQVEAWFARAVGSAGDVNSDGYSDVIVGAPKYDNDQTDEGRAFAFYGSATGLSTTADWIAEADQAEAWFGRRLATAGDVNGDGYDDVIVGAPNFDTGNPDGGKVYVYYGTGHGLRARPAWTAWSNQDHAWFGRSVAPAGDVNGDGYDDVIIGAPLYDNGEHDEGRAFAFYGSAAGLGAR